MNKKDRQNAPAAVGGASLLVIFAVLCLTIFALLSLTSVRANERLSKTSAGAVLGYYAADCEAQEILAHIINGETTDKVKVSGEVYSYECSVSETQKLDVSVRVNGSGYSVLRWTLTSAVESGQDAGINVWDGDEPK